MFIVLPSFQSITTVNYIYFEQKRLFTPRQILYIELTRTIWTIIARGEIILFFISFWKMKFTFIAITLIQKVVSWCFVHICFYKAMMCARSKYNIWDTERKCFISGNTSTNLWNFDTFHWTVRRETLYM